MCFTFFMPFTNGKCYIQCHSLDSLRRTMSVSTVFKVGELRISIANPKKPVPKRVELISYDSETDSWLVKPWGVRKSRGSMICVSMTTLKAGKERYIKASKIHELWCTDTTCYKATSLHIKH